MAKRYQNLLSPIRVGSRLLKSRLLVSRAVSGAFQGDENYPGEAMISHMAQLARAGTVCAESGLQGTYAVYHRGFRDFPE